ncbi:four helix bundle protein [Crocinitomicaceae bacterium]|jgi:four helix bundle protein|nr:four helix bundle protein [Crocinitomicaceae bacterium]MDC1186804.1 four helix bundle protein [Crocinitomicaceae bacterium]MDG1347310.1 four helix bundle protein [Crocinitomicaceae bacterium]MDG2465240.1 four helix bundle protein [Crocinitomicaceae bacterium]
MKESILRTKSYRFALDSVFLYKELVENKEFILSKQFMRSATSVGTNIREGGNAQSHKDFISKMSISLKKCGESQYWLDLLKEASYISLSKHKNMYSQSDEVYRMLSSIVITVKKKLL